MADETTPIETLEQLGEGPLITVDPDTIRFIIDKAQMFHAKEAVTITEEPTSPADDWAMQALADHSDDLTFDEIHSTISDLESDQQICLVALMWLGRGDFDVEEWDDALRRATEEHNNRTAEYLIATPLLASYLAEGMATLGYEDD